MLSGHGGALRTSSITGKLLWFSSLFRTFRPSLAPALCGPALSSSVDDVVAAGALVHTSCGAFTRPSGVPIGMRGSLASGKSASACGPTSRLLTPGASGSSLPPRTRGFVFCLTPLSKFSVCGWTFVNLHGCLLLTSSATAGMHSFCGCLCILLSRRVGWFCPSSGWETAVLSETLFL